MPPVRTFKSAPINPYGAVATTQQQAQQNQDPATTSRDGVSSGRDVGKQNVPAWAPATRTSVATGVSNIGGAYPAARPGAPVVPAPTSSSSSSTATFTPTKTYPVEGLGMDRSPLAPQPVGRPVPVPAPSLPSPSLSPTSVPASAPGTESTPTKVTTSIPPPPRKGEPIQPSSYYAPPKLPSSSSSTSFSAYEAPVSHSHPQPNPYAYAEQHQHQHQYHQPQLQQQYQEETNFSGQDILNTAKSWMMSTGTKLAEAEEEVWRMVNSNTK